jgi:hypothetical protein
MLMRFWFEIPASDRRYFKRQKIRETPKNVFPRKSTGAPLRGKPVLETLVITL